MRRELLGVSVLCALGAAAPPAPDRPVAAERPATAAAPERQRGVSWVAGRAIGEEHLLPLVEAHVNWIVQTPFGWQARFDSPEIALVTAGRVLWGETDEGLRATAELARRQGIRTLLKPHVWLRDQSGGKWVGEIAMADDAGWRAWFESYRAFILHYARFAQEHGIEALCIGTELRTAARERPEEWRAIIREIRTEYSGRLTYAANWYGEFEEVSFWDDLDFIGVQGYFPLCDEPDAAVGRLREGWRPHAERLEALSRKHGKPVVFTEIGYRSVASAPLRPWEWPQRGESTPIDLETQRRCYQAFFEEVWPRPWVAGAYWWKWYPARGPDAERGAGADRDFTPQSKPAGAVLAEWYGRDAAGRREAPP